MDSAAAVIAEQAAAMPPAGPLRMQRTFGSGRLSAMRTERGTRLRTLHQEGAAKLRFPRPVPGSGVLEAVLINTAGGMTGGDRLSWAVNAGAGSRVSVTTQACEKIYKASGGTARTDITLSLDAGAALSWLPQETILFDRSRLSRTLTAEMGQGSELVLCESWLFGRTGRGEAVEQGHVRDRWRIRHGGRLVHAEELLLDGAVSHQLGQRAVAGGGRAIATLVCIGERFEKLTDPARALMARHAGSDLGGGVSFMQVGGTAMEGSAKTGKLLARLVASDGYCLRQVLVPLIGLLNPAAGLPKSWSL